MSNIYSKTIKISIRDTAGILGKEECLERLNYAISKVNEVALVFVEELKQSKKEGVEK